MRVGPPRTAVLLVLDEALTGLLHNCMTTAESAWQCLRNVSQAGRADSGTGVKVTVESRDK